MRDSACNTLDLGRGVVGLAAAQSEQQGDIACVGKADLHFPQGVPTYALSQQSRSKPHLEDVLCFSSKRTYSSASATGDTACCSSWAQAFDHNALGSASCSCSCSCYTASEQAQLGLLCAAPTRPAAAGAI